MRPHRKDAVTQTAAAHRQNLQKSLQHRLEVARAKGDAHLVHLLEAEGRYLQLL
ncbi:MAG: hypothetical protein HC890_00915 [Chloroflexaceae bacterium]|nr:hypothetical protein [Chloroflexaceae bacterium]